MDVATLSVLCAGVLLVAVLYSSVGHAGASGYIAVMSLLGMAPAEIRPLALSLNILVALIASWQFRRAGHFSWPLFWPFTALAIPAAWLGGYLALPASAFSLLLGAVLLFSAARFFWSPAEPSKVEPPRRGLALLCGAGIGLLSGLTGTGGGIFLTPLLLLAGWARAKPAAAVSAPFILFNSTAGLLGTWQGGGPLPSLLIWLLLAAAIGGLLGSHLGSHRLPSTAVRRLLAAVLLVAGLKLLLGR